METNKNIISSLYTLKSTIINNYIETGDIIYRNLLSCFNIPDTKGFIDTNSHLRIEGLIIFNNKISKSFDFKFTRIKGG